MLKKLYTIFIKKYKYIVKEIIVMAKTKKLSLNSINKANEQYIQKRKIYVEINGSKEEVLIDVCFSPIKIQNLLKEYLINSQHLVNKEDVNLYYLQFLIIKYFSDISFLQELNKFEDQLSLMDSMINAGVYQQIIKAFNEFNENECQKIMDNLKVVTQKMIEYIKEMKKNSDEFDKGMKEIEEINNIVDEIIEGKEDIENKNKNDNSAETK